MSAEYVSTLDRLAALYRELVRAEDSVTAKSDARHKLPAGSSRARVTTANARWSTACEHRDRVEKEIRALRAEHGYLP